MRRSRHRQRSGTGDIWPGFVDALASLLIVVIFLLMSFVIAQYFLGETLSGRDRELDALNRELSDLADVLALERTANGDLRQSVDQLVLDLDTSKAERSELAQQLDTLKGDYGVATQTIAEQKAALADLQRSAEVDRETLEAKVAELTRLQSQLRALREARTALESDLSVSRQRTAQAESTGKEQRDRIAVLAAERNAYAKRIDELETTLAALRQTAAATEEALAEQQKSEEELASDKAALAAEVRALTAARDALRDDLMVARTETDERTGERDDARSRLEAAEARLSHAEQAAEGTRADSAELRDELARLDQALTALRSDKDATEATLADAKTRIATMAEERQQLGGALEDARSETKASAARLAALEEKSASDLDEARSRLAERLDEIRRLRGIADQLAAAREALQKDLRSTSEVADARAAELASVTEERDRALAALEKALGRVGALGKALAEAKRTAGDRAASLESDVAALEKDLAKTRRNWQAEVADRLQEIQRLRTLVDNLESARAILEAKRDKSETAIEEATRRRLAADAAARASLQQVATLTAATRRLREELAALKKVLAASQTETANANANAADLKLKLNEALANRVEELARYRSEFFGRLRGILSDRADIRIVEDRFVFQSEVLFATGSADLERRGKARIADLAKTLSSIADSIPDEIDWVLRVDGHTDRVPIATDRFPSNWELSTARAVAVVRELVRQGIPSERLIAAGFGSNRPISDQTGPEGRRRNRRIEFKLTTP